MKTMHLGPKSPLPIVFSSHYDIRLMGIEKLHPFDTCKYGRVFETLCGRGILNGNNHHLPEPVTTSDLLTIHTKQYLESLESPENISKVAEVGALKMVPAFLLKNHLLKPMLYATGGTLLGVDLALQQGWAINLGGGYHHAKANSGSGFCYFADINLAILKLFGLKPKSRLMVLDLDAHQGNGVEAILAGDPRVAVMDVFNNDIYPGDLDAQRFIQHKFPLDAGCGTETYLDLLFDELPRVLTAEQPDFIIYNAGTDILNGDPLGMLCVSQEGILVRDQFVFSEAKQRGIPILMLLSGGYTPQSAGIIADSLTQIIPMMRETSGA